MKIFYIIRCSDGPVRVFTDKRDAVAYVKQMEKLGYKDYEIVELEGY